MSDDRDDPFRYLREQLALFDKIQQGAAFQIHQSAAFKAIEAAQKTLRQSGSLAAAMKPWQDAAQGLQKVLEQASISSDAIAAAKAMTSINGIVKDLRPTFAAMNENLKTRLNNVDWAGMNAAVLASEQLLKARAPVDFPTRWAPLVVDDHVGVLSWDEDDETQTAVICDPTRLATTDAPVRKLNVEVSVRCSRCGKPTFLRRSSYVVTSETDVTLHFTLIPWCACMKEWDGTAKDLLADMSPPMLKLVRGDAEGDGAAVGDLRLVKADESKADE